MIWRFFVLIGSLTLLKVSEFGKSTFFPLLKKKNWKGYRINLGKYQSPAPFVPGNHTLNISAASFSYPAVVLFFEVRGSTPIFLIFPLPATPQDQKRTKSPSKWFPDELIVPARPYKEFFPNTSEWGLDLAWGLSTFRPTDVQPAEQNPVHRRKWLTRHTQKDKIK